MNPSPAIVRRLGACVLLALGLLHPPSWAGAAVPVIEWSARAYAVAENAGTVAVRVARSGELSGTSVVSFASTNGTAVEGVDYTGVAGTLTFNPGETNQTVSVPLLDNAAPQAGRFFNLFLFNPSNSVPGLQSNATVTILDDQTSAVLDAWFDPGLGANKDIFALGLMADGRILVGGQFTKWNNITGLANFTVLQPDGALDPAFAGTASVPDSTVYAVATTADGGIFIGGDFTSVGGIARSYFARVKPGGGTDTNFIPAAINNGLRAINVQPDGKILIAGRFTQVGGQPRNRVARLNADGSLDLTFAPASGADNAIRGMALQPDGRVLIGGQFTNFDGVTRTRLARLLTNGTLDTAFDPGTGADKQVRSVAVQEDGKILIGGEFENYNGALRSCVARLFSDGALDPGFDAGPSTNDQIRVVAPAPDGKVWIGGNFSFAGGAPRSYLALLGTNGLADPFSADAGFEVDTILTQPDEQTLVAGDFGSIIGRATPRIARLNTGPSVPRIQLAAGDVLADERAGQVAVTVMRRGDYTPIAQVNFITRYGSATAGADYHSVTGEVIFASQETAKLVSVLIINDSLPEPDETFSLALTNPAPTAVLVGTTDATITIQSDDTGFEFAAGAFATSEPEGVATITVWRGGTGSGIVSVDFAVLSGTALAGADFVSTNGTLIFQPGETQKTFGLIILADALTEGSETALLSLTNASAAAVLGERRNATFTIDDVDSTFDWYYAISADTEAGAAVWGRIIRTGNMHLAATVDWFTVDGTATSGLDYLGDGGTVTFRPGEGYEFAEFLFLGVVVLNDGLVEGDENLSFRLSNPSPGSRLGPATNVIANIVDNDGGLGFTTTNLVVSERSPSVRLTVRRFDDGSGPLSVEYFTSDGTAMTGRNYGMRSGVLNFPTSLATNTITIPLLDECGLTNGRVFSVRLRNPSAGAALGSNYIAVVTIEGNDRAGRRDRSVMETPPSPSARYFGTIAMLPDDQFLWVAFGNLQQLSSDGSLDSTFIPGLPFSSPGPAVAVLRNGGILASGAAYLIGQISIGWTRLLRPSGDWDTSFQPPSEFNTLLPGIGVRGVTCILEQPDGCILMARDSYSEYPTVHPGIRRLLANGTLDPGFAPGTGALFDSPRAGVQTVALQPDGKILLGGLFTNFSGVPCDGMIRLQTNGQVDVSFNAGARSTHQLGTNQSAANVSLIGLQRDGRILIAGGFTEYGGAPRAGIARLAPDGSLDTTFDPGVISGGGIRTFVVQQNGRIVIGGTFLSVQGQLRYGLARLNLDGSLDSSFDPAPEQYDVLALALQTDGRILVSDFNTGLRRVEGDPIPRVRELSRTNGLTRLSLDSRPEKIYALESSTNLVNWLRLQTNTAADCALEFIDAPGLLHQRFYRAVELAP